MPRFRGSSSCAEPIFYRCLREQAVSGLLACKSARYDAAVIEFHLDPQSGVATYLQIVRQVKDALRLGTLDVGDQLPTVREVVADLAVNPNTVAKAYRELEREGLVVARQGRGTFVASTLAPASLRHHAELRAELERWIRSAL